MDKIRPEVLQTGIQCLRMMFWNVLDMSGTGLCRCGRRVPTIQIDHCHNGALRIPWGRELGLRPHPKVGGA